MCVIETVILTYPKVIIPYFQNNRRTVSLMNGDVIKLKTRSFEICLTDQLLWFSIAWGIVSFIFQLSIEF